MPRRLRVQPPGFPLHVIQRGNNRQACFFADADYRVFLSYLADLSARCKCEVHAYVLMTNHFHLLLTPRKPRGASLLMKSLGQRYVQYVNKTHRRCGTLWDGRFRSSPVRSARYVLACYRYIEMNPVRAGMADDPGGYPWSSHAANADGKHVEWLVPHEEYLALGLTAETRRAAYRGLFAGELDPPVLRAIRDAAHAGHAIGSRRFRKEAEAATNANVMRQPARPYAVAGP